MRPPFRGINFTGSSYFVSTSSPSHPRRVIFLFLDGVGIGDDDPAANPLAARDFAAVYPTLARLLGGALPC